MLYELFDALGIERLQSVITSTSATFGVTSLPSGSYYLRLSSGGFVETRKVEIER